MVAKTNSSYEDGITQAEIQATRQDLVSKSCLATPIPYRDVLKLLCVLFLPHSFPICHSLASIGRFQNYFGGFFQDELLELGFAYTCIGNLKSLSV